jgi:hypothetical protein
VVVQTHLHTYPVTFPRICSFSYLEFSSFNLFLIIAFCDDDRLRDHLREIEEGAPSPMNQSRTASLSQSIVTSDSYHPYAVRAVEPDSHGDTSSTEADSDCWRDTLTLRGSAPFNSTIDPTRVRAHSIIRSDSHNRSVGTRGADTACEDGSMQPVAHTHAASKSDTAAQILRDREEIRESFAMFGGQSSVSSASPAASTAAYIPSSSPVYSRDGHYEVSDEEISLSLFDLAR